MLPPLPPNPLFGGNTEIFSPTPTGIPKAPPPVLLPAQGRISPPTLAVAPQAQHQVVMPQVQVAAPTQHQQTALQVQPPAPDIPFSSHV